MRPNYLIGHHSYTHFFCLPPCSPISICHLTSIPELVTPIVLGAAVVVVVVAAVVGIAGVIAVAVVGPVVVAVTSHTALPAVKGGIDVILHFGPLLNLNKFRLSTLQISSLRNNSMTELQLAITLRPFTSYLQYGSSFNTQYIAMLEPIFIVHVNLDWSSGTQGTNLIGLL